jgi:aspartyl-tRNA(Asn)/glutamyl-tRNA(Gln) amidotransferase subunit A
VEDLVDRPVADLAPLIRSGQVSPVELTRAVLGRIETLEPILRAYITVLPEQALADAAMAEAAIRLGNDLGPFHGIPIGVKDLLMTQGIRTTGGSAALSDFVPDNDATVVARLRRTGAIVVGKHNLHEFAFGVTNANPTYGVTRNPWRLDAIPGGSSGSSAVAVATGMCLAAIGTDTGGSIRIPASCCGVVGIKPTYGRVSRYGAIAFSWSLDHLGPIAKTVTDAALMLGIIAGHDPLDATTRRRPAPDYTAGIDNGIEGLRLGIPRNYFFEHIHHEVNDVVARAVQVLGEQGAVLVEVNLPNLDLSHVIEQTIVFSEAASYHETWLRERGARYAPDVRALLEAGQAITAPNYLKAQRLRTLIKQSFRAAMEHVDIIATPTLPSPPVPIGQETVVLDGRSEPLIDCLIRYACPLNLSGQPAVSVPCGFTHDGLPIGLQLVGRPFAEAMLCRTARVYEAATEWHRRRPPVTVATGSEAVRTEGLAPP